MKNKGLKLSVILIIMILILGIASIVQANSISQIDMDIYVNENGNATITETWNCYTNKGTEVYHPYYNLGNSRITNLKVYENGKQYTTLNTWNTQGNLSNKAYKCGINNISDGVELCWGISEYGLHTYTIKYDISKFVSELNDSQMIYWTLIPYEFSNSINKVKIKIYTNKPIEDNIDVWGYGNYGGLCYVNNGAIYMEKDNLRTSEYMTILAKFPLETYNCSNKINKNFEKYYKMAESGSTKYNEKYDNERKQKLIIIFWIIIEPIFLIIFFKITSKIQEDKEMKYGMFKKKLSKNKSYYREIPFEGNLFRAYYVGYTYGIIKNKTDLLGAIILKWIKEEKVKIKKIDKNGIFGNKEEIAIELIYTKEQIENVREQEIYEMLYLASKDGILEKNELKKWCNDNYTKILKWFDKVLKEEKEKLIEEGLIIEKTKKIIFTTKKIETTDILTEKAENLRGLKRFLLDYTRIKDKETIEVVILENYLIYAQILGIAKEVTKEFKDLYPELIEQTHYMSYSDVMWINYCSAKGIYAANSAERVASSYSSGGGGYSSRGGGRGSFGGGRGGGGFR